jgi:hypothetical protein
MNTQPEEVRRDGFFYLAFVGHAASTMPMLGIRLCFQLSCNLRRHAPETCSFVNGQSNPALDLASFGRWTLRDEAAQRR